MKIKKVKYFIGLDVHKKSTDYVVRDLDGTIELEGKCASIGKDLYEILEHYLFSCIIGLETNVEIYPIYEYFKEKSVDIIAGNTIQLRTLIGKNDRLDAKRISDMLRLNTFPSAFIPRGKIKQLRSIVKTRHTTLQEIHRLNYQIQALTRKYGLRMPSGESFTKRWKQVLEGYLVLNQGDIALKHLYDTYKFVNSQLEQITNQMSIFAKAHFPKEYKAISDHRGIGDTITPYLISEIHPITRFSSEKKLRRYAGVIPVSNETGDKVYSTYLPKTTSRTLLRYAFIEAASCMSKHDEKIKAYYKKKKKEKKLYNKTLMYVASSISDKIYKTLKGLEAS